MESTSMTSKYMSFSPQLVNERNVALNNCPTKSGRSQIYRTYYLKMKDAYDNYENYEEEEDEDEEASEAEYDDEDDDTGSNPSTIPRQKNKQPYDDNRLHRRCPKIVECHGSIVNKMRIR